MAEKTDIKIIMNSRKGKLEFSSGEAINFHSNASVSSYCDAYELTLKDQKKEIRDLIEPKIEIEIWVCVKGDGFQKIMAGYIDKIVTEKKEESDAIIKIYGRSYAAFLVDTKISGKIEFHDGYSQVVRMILKDTPFSEGKVDNSSEKGVLIFRNISIIKKFCFIPEIFFKII